ncbi:MAG: hypothetical protein EYC70_06050 [Planctomycetota bacterium]|nr:MAG: hypothetical protein EYC70_06050 [Planctomycetota bacterium]
MLAYALLTSTPGAQAPDEEIVAFYESGSQRRLILVGLYVMPFAGIAFLWFCMAMRVWLRAGSLPWGELVSGVQLASGILYVALFFAAAAASSVMAVSIEFSSSAVDPVIARQFPQYGATLLLGFAMRMAAMFVFTTSRLGRMTGVLPRWFAGLGLLAGLFLLLSASSNRALVLVFPLWMVALCAVLLARAWRRPRAAAQAPPAAPSRW